MEYITSTAMTQNTPDKVNEQDENGLTLLIAAARHGHIVAVRQLLKLNASKNSIDGSGQTALIAAIRSGHDKIALELITSPMDIDGLNVVDNYGATALIAAASQLGSKRGQREQVVDALLSKYEDGLITATVDQDGYNALHHAANNGHFDIVMKLITKGHMDPNVRVKITHHTPLILAAMNGHTSTMRVLLQNDKPKVDVEKTDKLGLNALHYSARISNADGVKILVTLGGANVNVATKRDAETPLYAATTSNCLECVSFLLANQANPNSQLRKSSLTPLMSAVTNGHVKLVELLVSKGADMNVRNKDGLTALEMVSFGNAIKLSQETRQEIKGKLTSI